MPATGILAIFRAMTTLHDYRYELRHNDAVVGHVRAGAVEVSNACNDEAFFWNGLTAMRRSGVALLRGSLPCPGSYLVALIVR